MLSKIVHVFGIIVIVLFCAASVLFAISSSGMQESEFKENIQYTSFFEDRFYDFRMKQTLNPKAHDKRLVLAAIDDKSLTEIGRWPWSRTKWSEFLRKMSLYGAKVVAFDVFFSEPELACNAEPPDQIFAKSIKDFQAKEGEPHLILPYSLVNYAQDGLKEFPDILYNFIQDAKEREGVSLEKSYIGRNVFPIQALYETDATLGHIQADDDPDGIFRQYPLVSNVGDFYLPGFGLTIYERFTGDKSLLELLNQDDYQLKIKKGSLALNQNGETKVRWLGGASAFPVVSVYDIFQAKDDSPEMIKHFKGNVVFIGSTAFGAHDLRHTPVDPKLPGIYFHMNMVHMLLEGNFFRPLPDSTLYSWIMLSAGTAIIIIIMLFGHAILDLFSIISIVAGLFYLDTYYLLPQGYDIKLFFCLLSPLACYSWSTFLNFYSTTKEKAKIKGTFSRYVSPAVVEEMTTNPDKVRVGGEKKNITVFFSDVRDFTSISEKLTPEGLSTCLNMYMGVMTDLIFENFGTLDKYIGDAIVAFWGAPMALEHHPYHALQASLKMIEALPKVNEEFEKLGYPQFEHGIGINTGDCSVGNMGSDKIFQYTALGDNMNLGARLEALCKFYGVQLNVSEYTLAALTEDQRNEFTYRILDKVRVKGKENAVIIYEFFHSTHDFKVDSQALADYNQAFEDYQNMNFQRAIDLLTPLTEKYPEDKSCKRIKEICEDFLVNHPGDNWDGVYTHTTKG